MLEKCNILLLEDELEFATSLVETLNLYFNHIFLASTIHEALEIVKQKNIDMIMSDIHLKKENGLDFIARVQGAQTQIPFIVISGFDDKAFLMKSIKLGVVDYLIKPFSLEEMESALQKAQKYIKDRKNTIYQLTSTIYFNMDKKILYENRQELSLTAKEFLFLKLVVQREGYVLSKTMIEEAVYGDEYMSAAALKNLLFRLRKKLGKDFIQTLPELGYKIHRYKVS